MLWIGINVGKRVASAYQLYCHGIGKRFDSASNAVIDSYHQNITDEFILAAKIGDPNSGLISNGDAVFVSILGQIDCVNLLKC